MFFIELDKQLGEKKSSTTCVESALPIPPFVEITPRRKLHNKDVLEGLYWMFVFQLPHRPSPDLERPWYEGSNIDVIWVICADCSGVGYWPYWSHNDIGYQVVHHNRLQRRNRKTWETPRVRPALWRATAFAGNNCFLSRKKWPQSSSCCFPTITTVKF